jgi:hypothetical protein
MRERRRPVGVRVISGQAPADGVTVTADKKIDFSAALASVALR